jgi:uncharacterized OB-fold protein
MSAAHWCVRQRIEIPFQYTAGLAVTRFLQGLTNKKIVTSVCSKCGWRSVPPLSFCGRCWQPVTELRELRGTGQLLSYSSSGDRTFGLIHLDGADSSLVHWVVADGGRLKIGSPVEPVWQPERSASILDIEHFRAAAALGKPLTAGAGSYINKRLVE